MTMTCEYGHRLRLGRPIPLRLMSKQFIEQAWREAQLHRERDELSDKDCLTEHFNESFARVAV